MKLSAIKTNVTVALMKTVTLAAEKDEQSVNKLQKEIGKQCKVVAEYYGGLFLEECMKDSEKCLKSAKKFDAIMNEIERVGQGFSTNIEAG
tara:strand:+ start:1037 stop:1309 length:273 start_codon:yes stop_codon:yes gene_type:complete